MRPSPALLWLFGAACGGVSHHVPTDVPAPDSVAVLPFAGAADPRSRELARALLVSRLRARGVPAVETAYVDRRLAENGWLADPARFDPAVAAPPAMATALGVDAVIVGTAMSESSFNLLALRRHAFGGDLAGERGDGRRFWSAAHAASRFGGLLLTSGQVIAELRAQGEHGTPAETVALVDEFVEDVVATVPAPASGIAIDATPVPIGDLQVDSGRGADGATRWTLAAPLPAQASAVADFEPGPSGVPMSWQAGIASAAVDLPAGQPPVVLRVRARSPFGIESQRERRLP